MEPLVLLDRDGTINVRKHYLSSPDELELLVGAAAGIRYIRKLGLPTIVVTNQSAIGRRYFDLETLDRIHRRLSELLAARGAFLNAIYVCPHHPDVGCSCRKPAPGLARKAAEEFRGDLRHSFVVGDAEVDIEMGRRIGATTLLICADRGAHLDELSRIRPDYVVGNLLCAAFVIQRLMKERKGP
jgi:D-glycero-D-manno-heptose 1,7-bisphosphate phosphatase